jgi:hypothetical protein
MIDRKHYLFYRWHYMRNSVNNPHCHDYPKVGGRGIKIDPAFDNFENYVEAVETHLGPPPTTRSLLARKDQTGNWTIDNMEWTTHKALSRRLPVYPSITHNGTTATIKEWSDKTGINSHTLRTRWLRGWPIDTLLTTPARNMSKKTTDLLTFAK